MIGTELKFNTDGTFKDGKGALNFVGNDGSLLEMELSEGSWAPTVSGGYYWDIGSGFGFQINVIYNSANNDVKGEAQFLPGRVTCSAAIVCARSPSILISSRTRRA